MSTIDRAIQIATKAHAGQTRRNGEPYILHPLRVMLRQETPEAMIVAVLHDVAEDTVVSLDDLRREGFGEEIMMALALLTHDAAVPYNDYIERIAANPLAVAVKLADLQDNMDISQLPVLGDRDRERLAKYHRAWKRLRG